MRLRVICAAAMVMTVAAHPAQAEKPGKVEIGPGSPKGALLFEVPFWPVHQMITFARNHSGKGDPEKELIGIRPRPGANASFQVMTMSPGEYRLVAVYQQMKWAACLAGRTIHVTIKPGEVAYLGTLDTRPTLGSIQRKAKALKHKRAQLGEWFLYRSDLVSPRLAGRDPEGLARAEGFVREHMPRSSAPVSLAELRWAPYQVIGRSGGPDSCE